MPRLQQRKESEGDKKYGNTTVNSKRMWEHWFCEIAGHMSGIAFDMSFLIRKLTFIVALMEKMQIMLYRSSTGSNVLAQNWQISLNFVWWMMDWYVHVSYVSPSSFSISRCPSKNLHPKQTLGKQKSNYLNMNLVLKMQGGKGKNMIGMYPSILIRLGACWAWNAFKSVSPLFHTPNKSWQSSKETLTWHSKQLENLRSEYQNLYGKIRCNCAPIPHFSEPS